VFLEVQQIAITRDHTLAISCYRSSEHPVVIRVAADRRD